MYHIYFQIQVTEKYSTAMCYIDCPPTSLPLAATGFICLYDHEMEKLWIVLLLSRPNSGDSRSN